MRPLDAVKQAEGMRLQDRKGSVAELTLLPPLTDEEMRQLESGIPCPLPEEARELFSYCRGFKGAFGGDVVTLDYEGVVFSGFEEGQYIEELFPHPVFIAADQCGNSWAVDLTGDANSWGPIFYICHDPPVVVFQTESLAHFISELLRLGTPPWQSEIQEVYDEYSSRIWADNPGVMTQEQCLGSGDAGLEAFARSLDETFLFVDLRRPALGDGFSWGRYGAYPETLRRHGEERIFAYQIRRQSLWERLTQW